MSIQAPAPLEKSPVDSTEPIKRTNTRRPKSTGVLAIGLFLSLAAMTFVAPPRWGGNSGLAASDDKHARLESIQSPKIVLVGGSNVSLGMDSDAVQTSLHRQTVNMGMGASMGLRYQLEEIRDQIKPGDLVVVMPEYGNFYKVDKDYSNSHFNGSYELLNLYQACPKTLRWMLPIYTSSPAAMYDGLDNVRRFLVLKAKFYKKLVAEILQGEKKIFSPDLFKPTETLYTHRDAYNSYGDFIGHLKLKHPVLAPFEPIIPGEYTGFDLSSVRFLNNYAKFAASKGASVVIIPPVFPKNVVCRYAVMDIYQHWKTLLKIPVLASPDRYSFDWSELFDTPYHVNAAGRVRRTQLVIEDLQRVLAKKEN